MAVISKNDKKILINGMTRKEAYRAWADCYQSFMFNNGSVVSVEMSVKKFREGFKEIFGISPYMRHTQDFSDSIPVSTCQFRFSFEDIDGNYSNSKSIFMFDAYKTYYNVSVNGRKFVSHEGEFLHVDSQNKLTLGWAFIRAVFDYLERNQ